MGTKKRKRAASRACRAPMQSPGRPPVWRREHQQRFWDAVRRGLSSEEAAVRYAVNGWRAFAPAGRCTATHG